MFWEGTIIDLGVAGVRLTDLEVDVLHHGGPVLAVTALPNPDAVNGDESLLYDENDEVVFVPLEIDARAPEEIVPWPDAFEIGETYAEHVDRKYETTEWRAFPCYLGCVGVEAQYFTDEFLSVIENITAWRFWHGRPLRDEDFELVTAIVDASQQRVRDSHYPLNELICHEPYVAPEMVYEVAAVKLGLVRPPNFGAWREGLHRHLLTQPEVADAFWADPSDFSDQEHDVIEHIAPEYAALAEERRIYRWSWDPGFPDPIHFHSMEHYLQGNSEALRALVLRHRTPCHHRHAGPADVLPGPAWPLLLPRKALRMTIVSIAVAAITSVYAYRRLTERAPEATEGPHPLHPPVDVGGARHRRCGLGGAGRPDVPHPAPRGQRRQAASTRRDGRCRRGRLIPPTKPGFPLSLPGDPQWDEALAPVAVGRGGGGTGAKEKTCDGALGPRCLFGGGGGQGRLFVWGLRNQAGAKASMPRTSELACITSVPPEG